jgi:acyl dehydratase
MPQDAKVMPAHDDLQPLSKTQIAQIEEYLAKLERTKQSMWDLAVGAELTWDMKITPELVILYCDGAEDYNPWYEAWPVGPGASPFGTAVAPPLLVPRWQSWFHREGIGKSSVGAVAAGWRTELVAPVMVGTTVQYHGEFTKKYVKRGRQYTENEVTVKDVDSGQLLVKHAVITLAKYEPVAGE